MSNRVRQVCDGCGANTENAELEAGWLTLRGAIWVAGAGWILGTHATKHDLHFCAAKCFAKAIERDCAPKMKAG